jgi:F-type H+-transporting ATPase subunit a
MSEHDHFHHVRDYTYFEVPKFLTSPHAFESVDDVPWHTLKALHLHDKPTLSEVNQAMEGKIFIPQPFAGSAIEPGLLISKFMVLQLVVLVLCLLIFRGLAKRIGSGVPAKGRFWNFWEAIALFIRDEVVRPTIGDHSHDDHHDHGDHAESHGSHGHGDHSHGHASHGHAAHSHAVAYAHPGDKYLPFVWSCFFYILLCNLLGAVPFLGSATGEINVTGALALTALVATFIYGVQAMSVKGFFGNLIPETGVPGPGGMALGGMMFVIELLGFFIKHGVLAVRLFANIMGGHTVLGVILGFIAVAATKSNVIYGMVVPGSVIGQVFIGCLELFVAFLQAYVFSFLATIFIAGAIHKH